MDVVAVITLEERHDEPRSAIAALGPVALDHFLLHGMQVSEFGVRSSGFGVGDAFDADDFTPRHQAERHEATVDGAITRPPLRVALDEGDRARAAIAFRATFLRAGQAGAAQEFKQRRVGRTIFNPDDPAVQDELDGDGHKAIGPTIPQKRPNLIAKISINS